MFDEHWEPLREQIDGKISRILYLKSKEKVRFSYQFLQHYEKVSAKD